MKLPGQKEDSERVFAWQDFTDPTDRLIPPEIAVGEKRVLLLGAMDSRNVFRSTLITVAQGLEELLNVDANIHSTIPFGDALIVIASFPGED